MPLSDETARRLLPEGRPEFEPPRREVAERLAELEREEGDGMLPRLLAWHSIIAAALSNNLPRIADTLTSYGWDELFELAAGYVALAPEQYRDPLLDEARRGTDYVFGAALFDYRGSTERTTRPSLDMGSLDERLRGLPLVHVPAADILHAAPNVIQATSTCWAAHPSGNKPHHILTAAHNVRWQGLNTRVAFNGGLTGAVSNVTPYPVDAAVIAPNFSPPALAAQIPVEPVPVQTEPYAFLGGKSGNVSGKVTLVHVLPGVAHSYSPQRIYLDTPGQPGDSGALVRSQRSGRALGIYTGLLKGTGVTYVHSQAMEQAAKLLSVDLWE